MPRPTRPPSRSARPFVSIDACSKTTPPAASRGRGRWPGRACCRPTKPAQIEAALTDILERGRTDPALRRRTRRGRPQLRRAAARRTARRRRPPSAHRPLAQRTGVAGSAALPAAPHSAAAARARGLHRGARRPGRRRPATRLMPSFTHLRPAQPILVAHFFLAHVAALRRDHERLRGARAEADALPLGSGAIAGTSYDD